MLVVHSRKVVELPMRHREVECSSSNAVLFQHAVPTTSSVAPRLGLLGVTLSGLQLRVWLLRLLRPQQLLPRHPRPNRTCRWRMVSDLRRPRVLHARSTRCCKTRAISSRRAARVCNAAPTRTPPRRRGTPRRAARSEWPMMCVADAAEAALPARCERAARRLFFVRQVLHVSTRAAALFFGLFARAACVRALAGDSLLACALSGSLRTIGRE